MTQRPPDSASREAFEAAMLKVWSGSGLERDEAGQYVDYETRMIWEISQAALKASGAERDAVRYRHLRAGKARTTGAPKAGRLEVFQWQDRQEGNLLKGDALDAACDAAIAHKGEGAT